MGRDPGFTLETDKGALEVIRELDNEEYMGDLFVVSFGLEVVDTVAGTRYEVTDGVAGVTLDDNQTSFMRLVLRKLEQGATKIHMNGE